MKPTEELFLRMNRALRFGQFDQLKPLQEELELLADQLKETDPEGLKRLRDLAGRSARLLLSARLGLQEGQQQYRDIQNPHSRIVVYHPDGRKRNLMIGGGTSVCG